MKDVMYRAPDFYRECRSYSTLEIRSNSTHIMKGFLELPFIRFVNQQWNRFIQGIAGGHVMVPTPHAAQHGELVKMIKNQWSSIDEYSCRRLCYGVIRVIPGSDARPFVLNDAH